MLAEEAKRLNFYTGPVYGDRDVSALGPFAQFGIGWKDRMSLIEAQTRTLEHLEFRLGKLKVGTKQYLEAQAETTRLKGLVNPRVLVQYVAKGEYKHLSAKQKRNASKPGKGKKGKEA